MRHSEALKQLSLRPPPLPNGGRLLMFSILKVDSEAGVVGVAQDCWVLYPD